jgi:hypothetical protein
MSSLAVGLEFCTRLLSRVDWAGVHIRGDVGLFKKEIQTIPRKNVWIHIIQMYVWLRACTQLSFGALLVLVMDWTQRIDQKRQRKQRFC